MSSKGGINKYYKCSIEEETLQGGVLSEISWPECHLEWIELELSENWETFQAEDNKREQLSEIERFLWKIGRRRKRKEEETYDLLISSCVMDSMLGTLNVLIT